MHDPRTRCRRSVKVSGGQFERKIWVRSPSSLMGRRLRSGACPQSRLLRLLIAVDRNSVITLTNEFLNESKPRLDTVIVFLEWGKEQRNYHTVAQNL
jgi:hypothetical protein